MADNNLKKVQENNKVINELVSSILNMRRENNITVQNGNNLDPIAENVFNLLTKNILAIYEAEYSQYGFSKCKGKQGVKLSPDREGDCAGGTDGLTIGVNLNDFLRNPQHGVYAQLEKSNVQESGAKISEQYDGSERDQMDLFLKYKAINAIDMDWIIDAIAHEAKHTYGVTGGNTFLKEGITEQTTREDCDKYGMYMEPTSHTQEANFIRKLELIVGREEIVKAGLYDKHIQMRNSEFLKIMQENNNVNLEDLQEYFKISRYDDSKIEAFDRKEKDESKKMKLKLEKFRKTHPELVDRVIKIRLQYDKMNSEDRYKELDLAFNKKFESRNPAIDLKKMRDMLNNLYSLQMKHKIEPDFYRKLYSENWSNILSDDDWKILLSNNQDSIDLEQLKKEGIDIYGTGEKIKSYSELIEPITTYIKENNLDRIGNRNAMIKTNPNLDKVIQVQEDVISSLSLLNMQQKEQIEKTEVQSNKQNTDTLSSTKTHKITKSDIVPIAKKAPVANEKENAMETRNRNEKESEKSIIR